MTGQMGSSQAKPTRKKGAWRRWVLGLLLLVFFGGLGLELALRKKGYADQVAMYFDQDIGFRAWPNQTRWQRGREGALTIRMRVNSLGFRGPVLEPARSAGVGRVLTLGDSYNFGLGVEDGSTYPVQLEEILNAKGKGDFEVMDISYPGWAPANAAAAYRLIGRDYKPDVVVFGFTWNDLQPPDTGYRYTDGLFFQWFGRSAIAWAITRKWLNKLPGFLIEVPADEKVLRERYLEDVNRIPLAGAKEEAEPYWAPVMESLVALRAAVEADGGRLVVVYFPSAFQMHKLWDARDGGTLADPAVRSSLCGLQEELARRCKAAGIVFQDCTDAFAFAKDTPFNGLDEGHPGPRGLRWLAERVALSVAGERIPSRVPRQKF